MEYTDRFKRAVTLDEVRGKPGIFSNTFEAKPTTGPGNLNLGGDLSKFSEIIETNFSIVQ